MPFLSFFTVHPDLIELHMKLLRKLRKTVHQGRWERSLIKFCYQSMSNQDAWEIERFGYKKAGLACKLRILKVGITSPRGIMFRHRLSSSAVSVRDTVLIDNLLLQALLEVQFDANTKFKAAINAKHASELRAQPIGKDNLGNAYWYHCDDRCNLFVFQENTDDETWRLVAR